jgi:hypothetical protein
MLLSTALRCERYLGITLISIDVSCGTQLTGKNMNVVALKQFYVRCAQQSGHSEAVGHERKTGRKRFSAHIEVNRIMTNLRYSPSSSH